MEIGVGHAYSLRMSDVGELYERDFYAWTQDQAALLRAWPEALRPNALDLNHLAEEIEDLGKSQRRAARSLLLQVIQHLLKLRLHPDRQSEQRWKKDVNGFRDQLRDVFAENPSLRAARDELAADLWARAVASLRRDLELDGFDSRAAMAPLPDPAEPCFDLDREILAEDWFPQPPAG
ncbi:DUF29 domain-containing protein [Dankookia sp. GCM10030260]|uniref:DUF29 domain-containing protein n=1 Tax=Dankookia sp. GCM10030260 TaxID=3273390 RepID=UPI00360C8782